ncbi:polypeptide N-acetylgalactosaminyltransferase 11-like, partial [Pogonomyrmex barbatus]|uniref:Polypeptide N-acetylgalactosaminyltransferase 11-like n=1 Tax=Pogonomyrmex barbatus TaxID=144034 RepID=A0A6I9WWQ9_9HYME
MISTRYVSFLSGIVIASLTWAFSLYLYSRLTQNAITTSPTMLSLSNHRESIDKEMLRDNIIIARNEKQIIIGKNAYNLKSNKDSRNNNLLLQQLQPVPVKPAITLEQGLDELGMVKNLEDQQKRDEGYKNYAFNVLISDNLGIRRNIPDTRHKLCRAQKYPINLANASIIICFYNEHYTT